MSKPLRTSQQQELAIYLWMLNKEKRRLRKRLLEIEEDERQAIRACAAHGMRQVEIAASTDLTKGRISQIVNDGARPFISSYELERQKINWAWDVPYGAAIISEQLAAQAEANSDILERPSYSTPF